VLNHPAHLQLLSGFIRGGNENDLLIITQRPEIDFMLSSKEVSNYLPKREIVRVPRLAGRNVGILKKIIRAFVRKKIVNKAFKSRVKNSKYRIERIVSIGAPIELRVGRKRKIDQRWYVSDTEPNIIAHKLGMYYATDILLPHHWDEENDGGWLKRVLKKRIRVHHYHGVHGHVHLSKIDKSPTNLYDKKKLLVRKIIGDGIHDHNEILNFDDSLIRDDFEIEFQNEIDPEKAKWTLPNELIKYDGVLTQSVTLATESTIQGVPTLLISKAKRGFLKYLNSEYNNFYRMSEIEPLLVKEWSDSIFSSEKLGTKSISWPNTRMRWVELLGPWKENLD